MTKIIVLDTSILCALLPVAGKEECGPEADKWDHARATAFLAAEEQAGTTLVLPLASIIETGNHVSQAPHSRFERATDLVALIQKTLAAESPWAAFDHAQTDATWPEIIQHWPNRALGGFSLGDEMIKGVAEFFAQTGSEVLILTGDSGLKAYEPVHPPQNVPRRRQ